jgi:hypothetical protein
VIERQGFAVLAFNLERKLDVAALDVFLKQLADGGFEPVAALRESELKVEKAMVDAL